MKNGSAVSHAQLSFAFMYNTNRVKAADVPRTWADLVDPKWKGQTLLVDPRSSATFRAVFHMIRQHIPDILQRIVANDPRLAESPTPAAQQLAAGTGTIAYPQLSFACRSADGKARADQMGDRRRAGNHAQRLGWALQGDRIRTQRSCS